MAVVTLTIYDTEDEYGQKVCRLKSEFDPPIKDPDVVTPTVAQMLALVAIASMNEVIEETGGKAVTIDNAGSNN